jgi:hypothetical protein
MCCINHNTREEPMVRSHPSTPEQRAQWVSQMLVHAGEYGFVTRLSRVSGVSRQTLYAWTDRGRRALEHAFTAIPPARGLSPVLERQILNLLLEGHPSYRGIQICLRRLTQQAVSLGTIAAVIQEAQRRALDWMTQHVPPTARTIALDEIYGHNRRGAYLNLVDTASYAVWAAEGPVPVDAESWTLLLWLAQERGLRWQATISDGGAAMHAACRTVDPHGQHGRDVWHVFQRCAQVQGRLDRHVAERQGQTATVMRQAVRVAAGQRPRGHHPRTDVAAHLAEVAHAQRVAESLRYLTGELQALLEVVVLRRDRLLSSAARRCELDTLLVLLAELRETAPVGWQQELTRLHKHVAEALPDLLAFAARLDCVQQDMAAVLGEAGMALVGWAWQRRAILGPSRDDLLAGLPECWRGAARVLTTAWEGAVRASSAVENWHSIVRPHLAVHRKLAPGMLALLAVWHNHRVFTRGVHKGYSPLQLSGMPDTPTDWLVALGYPPDEVTVSRSVTPAPAARLALAA